MKPDSSATRAVFAAAKEVGVTLQVVERDGPLGLSVRRAAQRLDCSAQWIRDHLDEFPNTFLLGSDTRIPVSDLRKFMERHRVFKV